MITDELSKTSAKTTDTIRVLIADDDPPTRILLRAAISQWGYEVTEASNGEEAWAILQEPNAPRLLILDWLMPKLDGISLCERIKEQKILHPYTILLTQVTGTTNIIKGLEAGADEFLSKPFNMAELRSRLSVGARIIRFENTLAEQKTQVQHYTAEMEEISQAHAKALVYHSDLLSMLGSLIEKISEEMLVAYAKLEKAFEGQGDKQANPEYHKLEELGHHLGNAISLIKRLQDHSSYTPKSVVCNLNQLLQNALTLAQSATKRFKIETSFEENLAPLSADAEQLQELFLSLILSSVDATKGQEQPQLRVSSKHSDKSTLVITVEDSGKPVPEDEIHALEKKQLTANDLKQLRSRLGTAMIKELSEKYGGKFNLENLAEKGVRLSLYLPLQIKSSERAD